jgi:catechol 2,3-dioxygenase-like lactoylglutathione lyase family enzyme
MKLTQIKETCLYSDDLKRVKSFYLDKLGLHLYSETEGRSIFFRVGPDMLLFFDRKASSTQTHLPPHEGHGPIHFAFETEHSDYDSCRSELMSKDIPIIHDEVWPGGFRSCYFHDPDGHVLEIIEKGMWEYKKTT